jgi:hypothetical protein
MVIKITALTLITTAALLLASHSSSRAEIVNLTADLKGSEETPPTTSAGSGSFKGTYDTQTQKLTWTITFSGLTGRVTRVDFHGPAGVGDYGSIKVGAVGTHSPIQGSKILARPSRKPLDNEILSGNFYVNLHTQVHPRGEIRGQILKEK